MSKLFEQACLAQGLPRPTAEYQFAKDIGRKWRIDYYFQTDKAKVALEIEGGVRSGGRHTRPQGFLGDMEKYNAMSTRGIFLYRVVPKQLFHLKTFDDLKKILL